MKSLNVFGRSACSAAPSSLLSAGVTKRSSGVIFYHSEVPI